ncbi:MAG TPA: DUF1015 family protein [Burkholderiales bacterium]
MALIRPFRALRPPPGAAAQIASPPYDVMSTEEARAIAAGNPRCFLRVSRPEVDLPHGVDEHSDAVHARGAGNLREFVEQGWLARDAAPRFYVYRQRMGVHVQSGFVAAASVEEYDRGLIRKHELTRPDKEDDRTRHIVALEANDEPVFLTYRSRPEVDGLLEEIERAAPDYDFVSDDGIAHSFWVAPEAMNPRIERAFAGVPVLYIADGHHRSAAASRAHRQFAQAGRAGGSHGSFLAVIFPHSQMQILDYNRVVTDLNGMSPEAFLARVAERFGVEPAPQPKPDAAHRFGMYLEGRWHRLVARAGTFAETPLGVLDVNILQDNLLAPLLGIADPRRDPRIQFVGGIRGTAELERLVDSGRARVAFALFPTSLDQLIAIADAGEIMPPKSTWFEPKLRSGLVLHPFF